MATMKNFLSAQSLCCLLNFIFGISTRPAVKFLSRLDLERKFLFPRPPYGSGASGGDPVEF
jgi:hypothetical protein